MEKVLFVLGLLGLFYEFNCYPSYVAKIPNGSNVTNPCDSNQKISGVGHVNYNGQGERNQFGLHFATNNHVWNLTLCGMDSDGDGINNGVELGDPDCKWVAGDATTNQYLTYTGITHPGVNPSNLQC